MSASDGNWREFVKLGKAVAAELGEDWSALGEAGLTHLVRLRHPDGRVLNMHRDMWAAEMGRLVIRGGFPEGAHKFHYLWDYTEIGVSGARPVRQIAGEIRRRLLPKYEAELEKVRAYLAQVQAREEAREKGVAALSAVLPGAWRPGDERWRLVWHEPAKRPGGRSVDVKVSGDVDGLDVEVTLSKLNIDEACAVAESIAQGREARR